MNRNANGLVVLHVLCLLAVRAGAASWFQDDANTVVNGHLEDSEAAGVRAGISTTEDYLIALPRYRNVRDYGADGHGVEDDTTDILDAIRAVNDAGGGTLYFPGGTYLLNSATLARLKNRAIDVTADNVTILGAGRDTTVLQVFGTSSCGVFRADCVNNFQVRGLTIKQNGISDSSYLGYAIMLSNVDARADSTGFCVENCRIENCRCVGWIYVDWRTSPYSLRDVRIHDVVFQSRKGNMTGTGGGGVAADCIYLHDESAEDDGHIEGFEVSGCWADCRYIKRFLSCYRSCWHGSVHDNWVIDSGADKATNSVQSYAIMYYGGCKYISSSANRIINPWTCGFYGVSSEHLDFTDNHISGQLDTSDGTLATGAIALGACSDVSIKGGVIEDCGIGIQVQPNAMDARVVIDGILVKRCAVQGILVRESSTLPRTGGVVVSGCRLEDASLQITRGSGTTRLSDIVISDNVVTRGYIRIHKDISQGSVTDNQVLATNQTYGLFVASGCYAMKIEANRFTGPGASAPGTYGMYLYRLGDGSTVRNNTVESFYYGICGTSGSHGNTLLNVTEPVVGYPRR